MSSKDNDEERVMYSSDKVHEVIEELFQSLLSRYQIGLETSMKGSDFIFDCVNLSYWKCHKINFKRGGHI